MCASELRCYRAYNYRGRSWLGDLITRHKPSQILKVRPKIYVTVRGLAKCPAWAKLLPASPAIYIMYITALPFLSCIIHLFNSLTSYCPYWSAVAVHFASIITELGKSPQLYYLSGQANLLWQQVSYEPLWLNFIEWKIKFIFFCISQKTCFIF